MDSVARATELRGQGRFADALEALEESNVVQDRRNIDVLKVDLLEQVGHHGQATLLAQALLRSKARSVVHRSACEFVLARTDREEGDLESSLARLQRSVSLAREGQDLERACWSQLRLLLQLAESAQAEAATALLSEIRSSSRKLGDPQVTAALHIFIGEIEAK